MAQIQKNVCGPRKFVSATDFRCYVVLGDPAIGSTIPQNVDRTAMQIHNTNATSLYAAPTLMGIDSFGLYEIKAGETLELEFDKHGAIVAAQWIVGLISGLTNFNWSESFFITG